MPKTTAAQKARSKAYYEAHKEQYSKWGKQWRLMNADKVRERSHLYWEKNKSRLTAQYREYRKQNIEEIRRYDRLRSRKNKEQKRGYYRIYHQKAVGSLGKSCQICGENRVIDVAHIIPRRFNGNGAPGNLLYLCPTHHVLFDRQRLTEDEYNKIREQVYAADKTMEFTLQSV